MEEKNFIWKGTGTYQYHFSGTGTVLMLSFFLNGNTVHRTHN